MFVPEVDRRQSVANAFYAIARHNAMGYSPFSIESVDDPANSQFNRGYGVLHQLTPLILEHQGKGTMAGFLLDSAAQTAEITLGGLCLHREARIFLAVCCPRRRRTPRFGG